MFRTGIVKQQDLVNAKVRVAFAERDQMLSYWLPICFQKTQNDKSYWIPDVGEQVVCLMDDRDEAGTVLGSIYSTVDRPPTDPNTGNPVQSGDIEQHTYKDGTTVQFNRATKQMLAKFSDGASFKYDAIGKALTVALPSGGTMSVTANGATLSIDASGNVTVHAAGGINLITSAHNDSVDDIINKFNSHVHSGVQTGSGDTGVPTTQLT